MGGKAEAEKEDEVKDINFFDSSDFDMTEESMGESEKEKLAEQEREKARLAEEERSKAEAEKEDEVQDVDFDDSSDFDMSDDPMDLPDGSKTEAASDTVGDLPKKQTAAAEESEASFMDES